MPAFGEERLASRVMITVRVGEERRPMAEQGLQLRAGIEDLGPQAVKGRAPVSVHGWRAPDGDGPGPET